MFIVSGLHYRAALGHGQVQRTPQGGRFVEIQRSWWVDEGGPDLHGVKHGDLLPDARWYMMVQMKYMNEKKGFEKSEKEEEERLIEHLAAEQSGRSQHRYSMSSSSGSSISAFFIDGAPASLHSFSPDGQEQWSGCRSCCRCQYIYGIVGAVGTFLLSIVHLFAVQYTILSLLYRSSGTDGTSLYIR